MVGSLIAGRYRLDELIGQGGVASVYKALDTVLERPVAVKVLRPEMAAQPETVARFRREAHAAAKLNHPNIVQIYDTGVDGETYYIVMEYLPEPDLKRIIKEYAPLPQRKVLEVSIQCARALAYAHKQGLVHRDVKPHNILFTDDGRVKLSDFGIAAAVGDGGLTESGLVLGSAYYISPEQAQGAPATAQSDIYSLGVVMFECMTGRPPFSGATPAEIAARHVRERPPALRALNPGITPAAEYVINKAMARELTRRYRGADEMLVDLEKIADGVELDRTGVLSPGSDEATMRLAPTQIPVGPPVAEAPVPTTPRAAPVARPAERSPGSTAAVTAAVVIVGIIALVGIFMLLRAAFYPGQTPRKVQVPSVKGMTLADATTVIQGAGLKVGKVTYEEDDTALEGTVIRQVPDTQDTVEADTSVNLVIRRGKRTVTVPDVRQRTLAEASERLQDAGLQVGETGEVYHSTIPPGQVTAQAIPAGTKVESGTAVDLTLSRGPEKTEDKNTTTGPDDAGEVAEDPVVEIRQDEGYAGASDKERKFTVKVSATGKQRGQKIQIVKSDDTGRSVEVAGGTVDPGVSKEWDVVLVGNASIEVYHNDKVVFSEQYPLSPQP